MVRRALGVLSLALLLCPAAAAAQDVKSGDLAKQLTQLLDSKKLDTLYFPGTQLLVVSAKYTQPSLLSDLIARKDFRGVYVELSSASIPSSKLLVMDAYANGLSPKPSGDQPADSIDRAGKESRFDGAWKKAKIPEADYLKSFTEADTEYTRLLLNQLKISGT
jgi:hypothetical protein